MAVIRNLTQPPEKWTIEGIPIVSMMGIEERAGKEKPVITKALVDLEGKPFQTFKQSSETWMIDDDYIYPRPIQYFSPEEITNTVTQTLALEHE